MSEALAWLGLLGVLLIALHWALDAALRRGARLAAPLHRLHELLGSGPRLLDPERRAERRRQARVQRAQHQREAIARASAPMPLDPPITPGQSVEWDGNVAHPQFGRRAPRQHNLH